MIKNYTIFLFIMLLYYLSNYLTTTFNHFGLNIIGFIIVGSLYDIGRFTWNRYLWKVFANKLHIPPNLNGSYKVEIKSSYDKNKKYYGTMFITQTYKNISISTQFEKSTSISYITKIEKYNDEWHILYSYQNTVKDFDLQESSTSHKGFSDLVIKKNEHNNIVLDGIYTNYERDTKGNMFCAKTRETKHIKRQYTTEVSKIGVIKEI